MSGEVYQRAARAWDQGAYADEVSAVPGRELERDESIRPTTTLEALARLTPVFRPDGTVTADKGPHTWPTSNNPSR
jgi:acetyl-CoA acetyltransferase